jgi:putative membrane protein
LVSFFSSFLVAFLPGVSSSIAAMVSRLVRKFTDRDYLVLLGGINTSVTLLSVLSIYLVGKARSGLALAVRDYASPEFFLYLIPLFLIAVSFGTVSTLILARFVSKRVNKIPYKSMNYIALIFTIILVFILTDWLGLLVLVTSTALGLLTVIFRVKRINCMSSLIIPTLLVILL